MLSRASLGQLNPSVTTPSAAVLGAGVGIVHLGLGAFHRAHQAVYTEDAMNAAGGDWRICGVSLRGSGVRDGMQAQDGLYSVIERSEAGNQARIIGSVGDVLFAPENPAAVIDAMARPETHVVSLTITEKGYSQDPATGGLMTDLPDIQNDLNLANLPKTALGYLARALKQRVETGAGPLNVISCDNLPNNGRILERLVLDFCKIAAPEIVGWVEAHVAFPCTMIDRIVPAATDEVLALAADVLGVDDQMALLTEPFKQWVIEDKFTAPRPAWEAAGAEIVADVAAFEAMKLRLLNASHSAIAYLGYLSGYKTVSDTVAVPEFKSFIHRLMDAEATPTLHIPAGFDVATYKQDLMDRFSNPTLAHKTWQIAMDGSQKLPQRLLETLYENLKAGGETGGIALAVAGWMQYVGGTDEQGEPIDVSDPYADELAALHKEAGGDVEALVDSFLALTKIFGEPDLQPTGLKAILIDTLIRLRAQGVRSCIVQ